MGKGGMRNGRWEIGTDSFVGIVPPDDDTLGFSFYQHVSVHVVCQGPDVWRVLVGCLRQQKEREGGRDEVLRTCLAMVSPVDSWPKVQP